MLDSSYDGRGPWHRGSRHRIREGVPPAFTISHPLERMDSEPNVRCVHRVSAAMWVWILPSLWFALRFLPALFASQSHSALIGGRLWGQFSGAACEGGTRALGCINFFVFTIPFVRGVLYSVGALFASRVIQTESQPANNPRPEQSQSAS